MESRPTVKALSPESPPASQLDRQAEQWQLIERILASPGFAKSSRLSSFLTYICECALAGRSGETQEQKIGIHVFGRSPGYNPSEDSIVRSQARLLRQKLEEYFEREGRNEPLRIIVPKGSYVPQFLRASELKDTKPADSSSPAAIADHRAATRPRPYRLSRFGYATVSLLLLVFSGLLATDLWLHLRNPTQTAPKETQRLWSSLFNPRQRTIIVPSDSTLILLEELTRTPVNIAGYSDHTYLNQMSLPAVLSPLTVADLAGHQYTSMADLNLTVRLSKLPQALEGRAEIRYARNLTLSDMKEANLVLIGGERANPWTVLFERETRFHVNYDPASKRNNVINLDPPKGAPATYAENSASTDRPVYGVISFLPGMCAGCDALLVQGTSMAGTEGASDFLFSNPGFGSFLRKIAQRDGSLPHFEVLLQTTSVGGNAPEASILAYHLLP